MQKLVAPAGISQELHAKIAQQLYIARKAFESAMKIPTVVDAAFSDVVDVDSITSISPNVSPFDILYGMLIGVVVKMTENKFNPADYGLDVTTPLAEVLPLRARKDG